LSFCDITNRTILPASEFDFLKNRILSEELAKRYWGLELEEACQEDFGS
jgi:hypothetical protein